MLAAEAVDFAGKLVEFVFCGIEDNVVSAGVVFFGAVEGFFEASEAGPGVVFGGAFRGNTPEIEGFEIFSLGVFNELDG